MTKKIIYDMPEDEYHALPRFSASGAKKLLVSSQDFWKTSWMNKDKRDSSSDAFNVGKAYHKRILEGLDKFNDCYAVKPDCDRRTKDGKAIYEAWLAEHPNAEGVDGDLYQDILAAKANELDVFKTGRPEVSVLWDDEETGIPMKCRIDCLHDGHIYDLKTFSNSSGSDVERLIARHMVQYQYHVQAAVYTEAMPDHEFTFVFQQTGNVNNCLIKKFPHDLLLADKGRQLFKLAKQKFAKNYSEYGTDPWYDTWHNEFVDESFPLWSIDA